MRNIPIKIHCTFAVTYLALVCFSASPVRAEVEVFGLRFNCSGCVQVSEEKCIVAEGVGNRVTECQQLLEASLSGGELRGKPPENSKLFTLLRRSQASSDLRASVIDTLMRSDSEEAFTHFEVLYLLSGHRDRLIKLLRGSSAYGPRWLQLYDELRTNDERDNALFVLMSSKLFPTEALKELLMSLDQITERDELLRRLDAYGETLIEVDPVLAGKLGTARHILVACLDSLGEKTCSVMKNPQSERDKILRHVMVHFLLAGSESSKLNAKQVLDRLLDFLDVDYATPQMLEAILRLLEHESVVFTPSLLERLSAVERRDQRIRAFVRLVVQKNAAAEDGSLIRRAKYLLLWLLLTLSVAVSLNIYVQKRALRVEKRKLKLLSDAEVKQLMNAYHRLGLPPWASRAELRRRYRKRVKELHPDTGSGQVDELVELHEDYGKLCKRLSGQESVV